MEKIKKGLFLFITSWVITGFLYFSSILISIGEMLQNIFDTSSIPLASFFVCYLLIVAISYFFNVNWIKANTITFVASQFIFGLSAALLIFMFLQAFAHAIMMNA